MGSDDARKGEPMPIEVQLLGDFAVHAEGQALINSSVRPERVGALFQVLALRRDRAMHRVELAGLLWPASPDPAGSLYRCLHDLRRILDAVSLPRSLLALHDERVQLDAAAGVDADCFRQAAREALASRCDEVCIRGALGLYTGELLPGVRNGSWAERPRQELRRLMVDLRMELASCMAANGRYGEAIDELGAVLEADSAIEAAHRSLMRVYTLRGRRDLALRQYDRCAQALRSELDAEPDAETVALAGEIRQGASAPGAVRPRP